MGAGAQAATAAILTLRRAGHEAFLVGGCVRDRLLGRPVHDHDVVTSAHPDEVIACFPRTVGVGRAFGVVVVLGADGSSTEVATYRSDGAYIDGRHPTGVVFTTAAADAARRDFTINALLQDPIDGRVIDHVGGLVDLQARRLRAVGDPAARLAEDRLRVLRALRFAAVLDFVVEPATWAALLATPVIGISRERIHEEWGKALAAGAGAAFLRLLERSGHLQAVTPGVDVAMAELLALLGSASLPAQQAAWLLPLGAERAATWLAQEPVPASLRRDLPWLIAQGPGLAALPPGARRRLLRQPLGESLAELGAALAGTPAYALAWCEEARRYPPCPLSAGDFLAAGLTPGPALGAALARAQALWFDDFRGSAAELLAATLTPT